MPNEKEIIALLDKMEIQLRVSRDQAIEGLNTAAVLRQKLSAGGRPVASRKGTNLDIAALAKAAYQKKQLKKIYTKH